MLQRQLQNPLLSTIFSYQNTNKMSYYSVFEKKFCGWKQQLTYNSRGHSLRRSKSPGAHHAETAILESCFKLCHCMARDGPFPRSSAVRNSSWLLLLLRSSLEIPSCFSEIVVVQFSKLAFLYFFVVFRKQDSLGYTFPILENTV